MGRSKHDPPTTRCRKFLAVLALISLCAASPPFADADKHPNKHDKHDNKHDKHGKHGKKKSVVYDNRSLIVAGNRDLFFSGSIHYPRSPPELWPELIQKAKEGGLNVVQTYVFWNLHEPVQGQYNFTGEKDLVKFIRLIGEAGLYATLRVGPFIEAEWNAGGFPYWLREVPNITFRSFNEPFMFHMQKYTEMIMTMMKNEKLFAPQGGPIILAQIENEYNNVQLAYRDLGKKYVEWAANMAVKLYDQIPWVMCKQKDAPPTVISTCNGRHCGETFVGPNGPDKPSLWTENWTAQYRTFGDPPSQRAAEDIAFAVALFFARNGTLNNYYMYHGGTNFGRSSSSFVTTRYYDEAPLDEYGLRREPKFGHLRDLHRALKLSKKALLWGTPTTQNIDPDSLVITFEKPSDQNVCAAFLINNRTSEPTTINFRGTDYYLPEKSISILPDCKTVVFNTMTIVSQHNARNFHEAAVATVLDWEFVPENLPKQNQMPLKSKAPLELYTLTKDTSDYAWYSTSIKFTNRDLPMKADILPVLQVLSLGHALSAFINGEYVGFQHGNNIEKSFVFQKPISLKPGVNEIHLLGNTVGFPNSGAYMEKRFAGPRAVTLQGLMSGTLDITMNNWAHMVGLEGERLQFFTEEGTGKAAWKKLNTGGNLGGVNAPLTWYKTYFDAPEGNGPLVIQMNKMAKGMIWVNGKSIGRYWVSFLSPLAQPTQLEYHIPRAYVKPTKNLLVVLEETGGDPREIKIMTVNRDTICSFITEYHPPHVKTWERTGNQMRAIQENVTSGSHLNCPDNKIIKSIDFAGFGDPYGVCGSYAVGKCNAPNSLQIVKQYCENKRECTIPMDTAVFFGANDACPEVRKTLAVQARCGRPGKESGKDDLDFTDSIDKAKQQD